MTIAIDGTTVFEQCQSDSETTRIAHHCATRRVAQVLAATLELQASGWETFSLSTADRPRRPLLLPGERIGAMLDGARSDQRAQGFSARRRNDSITVDACAGMPAIVLFESGDTAEARRIVEWHLGPLS